MAVKSICGAILMARDPDSLARFYADALGLALTREDHAGLLPHWGADVGNVHFGIHPPGNFDRPTAGEGSVVVTFDVDSLAECRARAERLGATCVQPPHDEGFGLVASFADPEGNLFELVELTYEFKEDTGR